ncbi:hypothetical protein SKAU_G00120510 [Synaphobranchus kaupii]|uniref:Uncharacterized protein n=1 Tax=Synaphobranchus kaupii TaxID=118154 RepID=A0A9Q1FNH0_SYNKA|nr:hypothetical protein SKAU_G00120510 [Synaphobranchus kaupii]
MWKIASDLQAGVSGGYAPLLLGARPEADPKFGRTRAYEEGMETRFSHLYQRDSSVSMLRVKMARRRSQSQKENRDRAVNRHRHLDQLPELETSALDESAIKSSIAASEGMGPGAKGSQK